MPATSEHWVKELHSLEGLAALTTVVLILLSLVVLPRHDRRELKLPAWCLVLHVLLKVLERAHPLPGDLGRVAFALAIVLLLVALVRVGFLLVVDWLIGQWIAHPMPRIFRDILQGVISVVALMVVFRALGVDLGSILTTSAILTAVIGLSLQETLGNLFAGLAVHMERPFEVGDWVQVGNESKPTIGRVVEINWRATKMVTTDRVSIVVPNGLIARSGIQNLSRPSPVARFTVSFQGPYEVPPNRIEGVVLEALRGCPDVLPEPATKVWTAGFADSGIDYQVAYYMDNFQIKRDIESEIRTRIWYALNRANISIPFPVRDVRIETPSAEAAEATRTAESCTREALLGNIELLEPAPPEAMRELASRARLLRYAAREAIVVEGDAGNELFILAEGQAAVEAESTPGEHVDLARLGPGQVFGELSLLGGVRKATVRAKTECQVLRLGFADLNQVISSYPGLAAQLIDRITARQQSMAPAPTRNGTDLDPSADLKNAWMDRIRRLFSSS